MNSSLIYFFSIGLLCFPFTIRASTSSVTLFEQITYRNLKPDPILNPNQEILGFPKGINKLYAIADYKSDVSETLRYQIRYRPIMESTRTETIFTGILDEAFFEWKQGQNFIYAGKKNNKDGVGLSANPTDFLGENKVVDKTKREEDRRIQREGDILLGTDIFQNNMSYSVLVSPKIDSIQNENRYLLKANLLLEELQTDVSALYFSGSLSGIGLNLSTTLGDSFVIYTETAYRYGVAPKKYVTLVNDATPRDYQIESRSGAISYVDSVLGGHYTFGDASTLIVEYYYHGGGYSSDEWNTISDFILYANRQYKSGFAPALMSGYLQQANALMNFGSMAQHYGFARYSKPSLFEDLDISFVVLANISDGSLLLNPYLTYHMGENSEIYLSTYLFSGTETAEFGLPNWNPEITMGAKWNCF